MISKDQFQHIIRLAFTILLHARQTYMPLAQFLQRVKSESKRSLEMGFIEFLLSTTYFITRSSLKTKNEVLIEFRYVYIVSSYHGYLHD